jgi:hypothetical protein
MHRRHATRFALVLGVVSALTGVVCSRLTFERELPDDSRPSGNAGQPTSQETTAGEAVPLPISEGCESRQGKLEMPLPTFDYGNVGYHGGAPGWVENITIEGDHSCGIRRRGDEICTKNLLYSNISGKIGAIQTIDRKGDPVEKVLWNVGSLDRCPLDAYMAQHSNDTRIGGT